MYSFDNQFKSQLEVTIKTQQVVVEVNSKLLVKQANTLLSSEYFRLSNELCCIFVIFHKNKLAMLANIHFVQVLSQYSICQTSCETFFPLLIEIL